MALPFQLYAICLFVQECTAFVLFASRPSRAVLTSCYPLFLEALTQFAFSHRTNTAANAMLHRSTSNMKNTNSDKVCAAPVGNCMSFIRIRFEFECIGVLGDENK